MTRRRRPLLQFLLLFALVYALLILPWPGVKRAYGAAFRGVMQGVITGFDLGDRFHLPPAPGSGVAAPPGGGGELWHELVGLMKLHPVGGAHFWLAQRDPKTLEIQVKLYRGAELAYMATAFLVALVLATPIRWRSRLLALAVALVLFDAYLVVRISAQLAVVGSLDPLPWLRAPVFERGLLSSLAYLQWYVAPVLAWAVAVARPVYAQLLRGLTPARRTR